MNGEKYMTLGQLTDDCKNILALYEKGIQVFRFELQNEKNITKIESIKNSIASAFAAICELYMKSDLW